MSLLELVNSRKRRHERPPYQQYFGHTSHYLARASSLGLISSRGSTAASGAISHISPMPHEHAAFLHPTQLPGCRSIALQRKFRALEGPTGGRWKWRLTSPASFHPSSFQSVFQTTDASLLPPSLSSRTPEHCEGPQTTLLDATSSTPPPRRLLAPELDTPRCRSSVKETALAIGDAATEPPPPRRRTVPRTGPRSCHCIMAAIAGASRSAGDGLLQISHQRLVAHGIGTAPANIQPNGQTLSAAPARCLPVCCPHDQRAKRARPLSQSWWPLPWIPCPRGRWPDCPPKVASRPWRPSPPAQVHLHHVCENPTHRSARGGPCTLNSVKSTKTLPMLRSTRRTFHRHTGGGPTSSGMSRNGLRPSPEQRTPSQKAGHPQSQPARVIESVAIVGVKLAGGRKSASMRRWHRRLRWRSSLSSLSGEDVAAT